MTTRPARPPHRPPPATRRPALRAKTVLLVDSHEDSRTIYTVILEHHGFRVLAAGALEEGARLARERRPDVIFVEYGYPRDRAMRLARALLADPALHGVPLVALSTAASDDERDRALAHGFAAYLVKPCSPLELLAETRRLCAHGPRA